MPVILHREINESTSLAVWKIEEEPEDLLKLLQLNAEEKRYYDSFKGSQRILHWLSSRVLLRTLIDTSEYINLEVDEYGKPYLVNFPFYISLSHSGDYAAVIISKNVQVGVDIELIGPRIEKIVTRFLSEEEQGFISTSERLAHLYACWSAKESAFKWYGKGQLPFIGGLVIAPFRYQQEGNFQLELIKENYRIPLMVSYESLNGYLLTYIAAAVN